MSELELVQASSFMFLGLGIMSQKGSLLSLGLGLALPPAVAFVTEDVVPHGPTLRSLHPGVKHLVTVLAFEALWMKVPVKSPNPGSLCLALLRHDGFVAH